MSKSDKLIVRLEIPSDSNVTDQSELGIVSIETSVWQSGQGMDVTATAINTGQRQFRYISNRVECQSTEPDPWLVAMHGLFALLMPDERGSQDNTYGAKIYRETVGTSDEQKTNRAMMSGLWGISNRHEARLFMIGLGWKSDERRWKRVMGELAVEQ